ncbi:4581_t:CDS:2, partial [Funneliformis geosporum]
MSICFTPRGIIHLPVIMNELYQALSCILKALNEVYKHGLMHRDLRWDNIAHEIGKTKDNANWFLLDFDEGSHTNSVDVWGIGYLLQTSNLVREDDKILGTLMKRCLAVNLLERPTISD